MSEFLRRAQSEIQIRRLLIRGRKTLVAVSGGADSMVLLHVLHSLAWRNRWQICVAHFNHRLRGRASDADENLVRKTAAKLKVPVVVGRADVKRFTAKSKFSVEMAARKLRHEFFVRTAWKLKIKTIALAHHADDQVELFFLRLLRGAGGDGLAGMKWRSPSPANKTISLVRPLLGFSKGELVEYARENKIQFRDDATNFSTDFLRNRIRNELLPLLRKKYQPGLDKAILRLMEIVGAEAEFTGEAARHWLCSNGRKSAPSKGESRQTPAATIENVIFDNLPAAIQRRVLQSQLHELGVVTDFDLIESLRKAPRPYVSIGPNFSAARDERGRIGLRTETKTGFDFNELPVNLSGRAKEAFFCGKKITWWVQPQNSNQRLLASAATKTNREFFDADKIGGGIVLRHWRAGDRFQPIGFKSAAKLQDLFVNAKISAARRRELVLAATADGEIFWVEGLRIGERFKLTQQTKRKLIWQWSNLAV